MSNILYECNLCILRVCSNCWAIVSQHFIEVRSPDAENLSPVVAAPWNLLVARSIPAALVAAAVATAVLPPLALIVAVSGPEWRPQRWERTSRQC